PRPASNEPGSRLPGLHRGSVAGQVRQQEEQALMKVGMGIVPQNYPDWDRYASEDWDAPYVRADTSVYEDALAMARLAEEVGLDSIWTVEHHFTPYIIVPNPVQFLTYIAGATRNMDVGSMVTVLPWHHPL